MLQAYGLWLKIKCMKYNKGLSDEFDLPRTEFLLRQVKIIEERLLDWYKKNKYSQGDDYDVRVTSKGKWCVSHSNDYPLQHGGGNQHVFSEAEYIEAVGKITLY